MIDWALCLGSRELMREAHPIPNHNVEFMFDLVYDFCVFVVRQLDPVLSIGAFYKLPMSDIRPTDQPMGECTAAFQNFYR